MRTGTILVLNLMLAACFGTLYAVARITLWLNRPDDDPPPPAARRLSVPR